MLALVALTLSLGGAPAPAPSQPLLVGAFLTAAGPGVRALFAKSGDRFIQADPSSLPEKLTWTVCKGGKAAATLETTGAGGVFRVVGGKLPHVKDLEEPLVAITAARCADPEGWKRAGPTTAKIEEWVTTFRAGAKQRAASQGCPTFAFTDKDVVTSSFYESKVGPRLASFTLLHWTPEAEAPEEMRRAHFVYQPQKGPMRYLEPGLRSIAMADVDGDGKSELFFFKEGDEANALVMYAGGAGERLEGAWAMHP
jgi:hypothetical protein